MVVAKIKSVVAHLPRTRNVQIQMIKKLTAAIGINGLNRLSSNNPPIFLLYLQYLVAMTMTMGMVMEMRVVTVTGMITGMETMEEILMMVMEEHLMGAAHSLIDIDDYTYY